MGDISGHLLQEYQTLQLTDPDDEEAKDIKYYLNLSSNFKVVIWLDFGLKFIKDFVAKSKLFQVWNKYKKIRSRNIISSAKQKFDVSPWKCLIFWLLCNFHSALPESESEREIGLRGSIRFGNRVYYINKDVNCKH